MGADSKSWPACLGQHGIGRIKQNGQRLLELCCFHGLCITNTYFKCKEIHKVSWRHSWSCHWHQLDLVITRRQDLSSVLLTCTYHSTDCNTDNSLVISKVRVKPKKIHYTKIKGLPLINTCCTNNPVEKQKFVNSFKEAIETSTSSDSTIHSGKKSSLRSCWFVCKVLAAHVYPESQCRFRSGRSTVDMIFL